MFLFADQPVDLSILVSEIRRLAKKLWTDCPKVGWNQFKMDLVSSFEKPTSKTKYF